MKSARWCSLLPCLLLAVNIGTAQATQPGTIRLATISPSATPTATASTTPSPTPIQTCVKDVCLVFKASPTPGAGTPSTTAGNGPGCEFWNPGTWIPCLAAGGIGMVTSWVTDLLNTAAVADVWTHTDPAVTYANPVVTRYWDGIRLIGDAFLGLLILGLAFEILLCIGGGQTYAGALERFWRLLLVAALSNGSLALIAQAVDFSNMATAVLDTIQQGPLFAMFAHGGGDGATAVLLEAVLALIDGVMELLLFLQMVVRLALLDVLTILAAPALLCYAWPRLQHWASLWCRLFVATLLTQFVQIVVLHMGGRQRA